MDRNSAGSAESGRISILVGVGRLYPGWSINRLGDNQPVGLFYMLLLPARLPTPPPAGRIHWLCWWGNQVIYFPSTCGGKEGNWLIYGLLKTISCHCVLYWTTSLFPWRSIGHWGTLLLENSLASSWSISATFYVIAGLITEKSNMFTFIGQVIFVWPLSFSINVGWIILLPIFRK